MDDNEDFEPFSPPSTQRLDKFISNLPDYPSYILRNIIVDRNDTSYRIPSFFANNKIKDTSSLPSLIVGDWLYLGAHQHCRSLRTMEYLGITHILNCSDIIPNYFQSSDEWNIKYARISVTDWSTENIFKYFSATSEFIDLCNPLLNACETEKNRILIHCQMGKSRSSTIVLAYLMSRNVRLQTEQKIRLDFIRKELKSFERKDDEKEYNFEIQRINNNSNEVNAVQMRMCDAYYYVQSCRTLIEPNVGFCLQLEKWENICFDDGISTLGEIPICTSKRNNRKLGKTVAKMTLNEDGILVASDCCSCKGCCVL